MLQNPDEKQIRELILDRQVVSNGRLVTQYELFNPVSYRILDQPLAILLTDELIRGSWTIEEFAKKIGINNNDVRSVLLPLMSDPSPFEGGYIPRRTGRDDRDGHRVNARYSFVPIPINARIFDPILGFSLLGWRSVLIKYDSSLFISSTSELEKQYCEKISSFWDIPYQKVINYFSKEKVRFIPSVYGILPVLESDEIYSSIKKKIEEPCDLLSNRFRRRQLEKEYLKFVRYLMQGPGTIPELQYLIVSLYDILSFCSNGKFENEYIKFSDISFNLFQMVFNLSEVIYPEIERAKSSLESNLTAAQCNGIVHQSKNRIIKVIESDPICPGNNEEICVKDSEVDKITDYRLKKNERQGLGSIYQRNVSQKWNLKKLLQDLESQNEAKRVSALKMIRSGEVSIDINLLILALKDHAWLVQVEALSVIKKQVLLIPPNELIPCVKSLNKKVWRLAIFILYSMRTLEALILLEKIALQCNGVKAERAIYAIVCGFSNNSKSVLNRIHESAEDQKIKQIALEMLQNM